MQFDTKIERNGETIIITHANSDPEVGTKVMTALISLAIKSFNKRATERKRAIESKIYERTQSIEELKISQQKLSSAIKVKQEQKEKLKATMKRLEQQKAILQSSTDDLEKMVSMLERNTHDLLKGKLKLSEFHSQEQLLSYILFSNNLQQNIAFLANAYERLKNYSIDLSKISEQMEKILSDLKTLDEEIKKLKLERDEEIPLRIEKLKSEIERLKAQRDQIEGIRVIVPPHCSPEPVRPRPLLNMTVAGVLGLFAGVLLAFLVEGLSKRQGGEGTKTQL